MKSYKHKIALAVVIVILAIVATTAIADSSPVAQPGPTGPTGLVEKTPKKCSTVSAAKYNKLLKKRSYYTGNKTRKFKNKPVCIRPTYRRLQESFNKAKARCLKSNCYWKIQWHNLSENDKAWTLAIGSCESGNDPTTNTGNGFYGAFQWVMSTWHSAGGLGSPVDASWHEQAVRAVHWRNKTSTMQWPACSVSNGYA